MLVIDGAGKTGRVMAVPRPQDAIYLVGGPFGTPGFDPRGRLVYRGAARSRTPAAPPTGNLPFAIPAQPDSAPVVRIDLETRKLDTVGLFKVQKVDFKASRRDDGSIAVVTTVNPMMTLDDWAMLSDGTVAFLRGRDYRIDWVAPDGTRSSTPKIPFDWQRLTDDDRAFVLDSARTAMEKQMATMRDRMTSSAPAAPAGGAAAARAGSDVGDTEGNLWIRTSKMVNNGAVYDVINRKGELIDRVLVPQFRMIAGFAVGGIVNMGVLDGTAARLEEARVR